MMIAVALALAPAVLVAIPMPSSPRSGVPLSAPFDIAFVNASNTKQTLLHENCSWGYEMVRFEIQDRAGKLYKVNRAPSVWDKNFPNPLPLQPGDVAMRKVNLTDGTWTGLPAGIAGSGPWKVRVILEIEAESNIKAPEFWIGSTASRWHIATPL